MTMFAETGGLVMNEIVDAEYELWWQPPIRVRVGTGIADTVRGPEAALEYLTYRWPAINGPNFAAARMKCLLALQKRARCEEAREAFISAAIEARMLA
jgi:hypothetical protein